MARKASPQRVTIPRLTSPVPNEGVAIPPPKYDSVHIELGKHIPKWDRMTDCLDGEDAVKARGEAYLPMPRFDDDESANVKRYGTYKMRAVYYNATSRTMQGLVGEVFSRDPIIKLPAELKNLVDNVDGAGVTLDQQAKAALRFNLGYGRGGLLADYPDTGGRAATVLEIQQGSIRPGVILYSPYQIINWRYEVVGGLRLPKMIVIRENYSEDIDIFETVHGYQWRVLTLEPRPGYDGDVYRVQIWRREKDDDHNTSFIHQDFVPLDYQGQPFREIPFTFFGPDNNNEHPDLAPMDDLAILNLAHYRNSADYEESCFLVGQPTAYFAGLTTQWVEDVFQNGKIMLGSRAAIPLPVGGTAGLLQVNPNSMPKEAMDQKERQMVALGAKLVVNAEVQRTLGEAQQEESAKSSILATATKNVSSAYRLILKFAQKFVGPESTEPFQFDLNTDFPASRLTPNDRAQLVKEWQDGAITFGEMRDGLRRGGIATMETEAAKADIQANPSPNMQAAQAKQDAELEAAKTKNLPTNAPSGGNQAGI